MKQNAAIIRDLIHYVIIYLILIVVFDRISYFADNPLALGGGLLLFIVADKMAHNVLATR